MTATPTPRPPARRRLALVALALTMASVMSSCTIRPNTHMEVDFLGAKYRFYIYEKPSYETVFLRDRCKESVGTARARWARCSLKVLREQIDVPAYAKLDWRVFVQDDQWDDYGGAVDNVARGGIRTDRAGKKYAVRCLTGDHTAFRDYNWTFREAGDGHCHRGSYAVLR